MPPQEEQSHLAHPKYRPDIDGLRAIAVLSVVGFHAFPHWVKGGFIGVDIFFVISGYLISTIIFGSLAGEGFSYREFYARRIRRIFPALLVVVAATLAFGWYALLADEFRQLGKHLLASAGFVVNLALWNEAGYFDTIAESKPLLHLWSLAVEEQFYIFWPVFLGLAWRSRGGQGRHLGTWMWVATGLSFLLNVYAVHRHPTATFYSPLPRMWELGAGALLAWNALRREPHRNWYRRELRSVGGLLLIVLGVLLIQRTKSFPGWWALLPVLGACLCISAGPGAWINRRLLGSRIAVWFGLISYPLYLWHWPLLAYARVLENGSDPPRTVRIAAVLAAIGLAWITYRYVEQRLRRHQGSTVVRGLATSMVLVAFVGALALARVLPSRNDDPGLQDVMAASADWAYPDGMRTVKVEGETIYRVGEGRPHVLLMGDSHVEQFGARAVELEQKRPDSVGTMFFATRGACPPIPHVLEDRDPVCGERFDRTQRFALGSQVDVVVIGGCWTCYFDIGDAAPSPAAPPPDNYYYLDVKGRHPLRGGDGIPRSMESLELFIRLLRAAGKEVYLQLTIPVGPDFEPRTRVAGNRLGVMHATPVSPRAPVSPSQQQLRERLRQVAERGGAKVIDPVAALCTPEGQCLRTTPDGAPIYKDATHLRAAYVRQSATFLDPALEARK